MHAPPLVRAVVAVVLIVSSFLFGLALAGVGSELLTEEATGPSPYARGAGAGEATFVLSAVRFGPGGTVTITNIGDSTASLAGYWLCQRPSYDELPATELAPGESVEVEAELIGGLAQQGGEVALYFGSSFADSTAIRSYVRWGEVDEGRSGVAVEAGVWAGGEMPAGGSGIVSIVDLPTSVADWQPED